MFFYKDPTTENIYAYNEDTLGLHLQEGFVRLSDDEYQAFVEAQALAVRKGEEGLWVADQMQLVADQLLMLDDNDPTAIPGMTTADWRAYRIALRAWKDGAEGFPDQQHRPRRPA
ncbi:hypothetical protein JYG34_19780 [Pseudomonas entomophila]|uniref:hypothetical protein n=1 Tax=Pseudomonas entomophila TaxID=312306 RepID=UPI001BCF5176|nr:hypothetical protein [Pseudomonas entomophila]QVM90227.1 hypothetical protein JYG34_19780 [Pseudomonas entomophila]